MYELRSGGVNVNTPVPPAYVNEPLPLALAVLILRSVNAIPSVPSVHRYRLFR